jgi:hypothetical protein
MIAELAVANDPKQYACRPLDHHGRAALALASKFPVAAPVVMFARISRSQIRTACSKERNKTRCKWSPRPCLSGPRTRPAPGLLLLFLLAQSPAEACDGALACHGSRSETGPGVGTERYGQQRHAQGTDEAGALYTKPVVCPAGFCPCSCGNRT